jgi:hypothetical protein
MNDQPRFNYHAHAVALEGEITHPFTEKIDVQAPSSVSPNGGFGTAQADPYNLRDIVSHSGARSHTEGSYHPDTNQHYAVAHVKLEGLNISDMVTVDAIIGRLTAVHSTKQEEPCISPHGSRIQGLKVAGHPIELIPLIGHYHKCDTWADLCKYYETDKGYREELHEDTRVGVGDKLPEKVRKFFPWRKQKPNGKLPQFRGHTIVPLFRVVNPNVPGIEVYGNLIVVQNFGRILVGELVISSDERRVTMLRAELGSPIQASMLASTVCGGGGQNDPP